MVVMRPRGRGYQGNLAIKLHHIRRLTNQKVSAMADGRYT
jgi:hypothetical protein